MRESGPEFTAKGITCVVYFACLWLRLRSIYPRMFPAKVLRVYLK